MKFFKLTSCLLFAVMGCAVFADYVLDFRAATTPEKMQEVLAAYEAALPTLTKGDKIRYSGLKMVYYFRTAENPTYMEGQKIYIESIKALGVEKEGMESGFLFGIVHPWWTGKKNVALMEEALSWLKTQDELSPDQWVEAGRIMAFGLGRHAEAVQYFENAGSLGYNDLILVYIELGNAEKAIEVYYKAVTEESLNANDAAVNFQKVWPLQVRAFKSEQERSAAKFQLQKLVDLYNNKLYTDTKVKPENSPWRAVITLWAANSK